MTDTAAPATPWIAYSFAVLCVVPHPHLGTAVPVGVIVHARTEGFLGIQVLTDPAELAARERYLAYLLTRIQSPRAFVAEATAAKSKAATEPPRRLHSRR